jgi:sulfite exporter TauE/SafE
LWGLTASLSVLLASLVGSAHCVGMCGGLVTSVCRTRAQWAGYQAGRFLSYSLLGALAGWLGHALLKDGALHWIAWASALFMAAGFFALAARAWKGQAPHFSLVPNRLLSWLYRKTRRLPLLMGFLSAALPCGWLQTFVLAAAATQSAAAGAGLMTVFWLGTLPALSATPWLMQRILRPLSLRAPKLTAVLLILAGLSGIGFKMSTLFAAEGHAPSHCHCDHPNEFESGKSR